LITNCLEDMEENIEFIGYIRKWPDNPKVL